MRSAIPAIYAFLFVPVLATAQTPAPAAWDISQSLGPAVPLDIRLSEGTWMNLDVSPDGRTIVFDLLGDLYTMPIAGTGAGLATRISSGPAFDMQPRFSPDGRNIALISDRAGGNNIWIVNLDGTNPRQVSKESQRLVNSPAWSPDGQYVYVRKHFVKERSNGAGEVWMYHVSGADGLQVTERNGWQKDAGEPALSPDGRYLYYSKDLTPGSEFQYNKNPYPGIYGIIRRDLTTGRERTESFRPGGSITPRVSPDGKTLAFVRRVDLKSVLFLRDLATGREWPVFDRLDRDMQEAWSIHGVYTQYAWTPDSKRIVIWGEGKIWNVDVEAKSGAQIPFTAHVQQTLTRAVRFPQQIAQPEFTVRMLRDVETAPDGRSVVYSALGKLYRRDLPAGTPVRITQDTRNEFAPSYSRDGAWITYATWSDAEGGRIRVMRADGSMAREVVRQRGHYTDPSFSPDGRWIVYRTAGGDGVRGLEYGVDPGVFIVPVDGSKEPTLVTQGGSDPAFDHTGQRIYLRGFRNDKQILYSVALDGSNEVVHFQSDFAVEIIPSPDGKWVAFSEKFQVYVAAFPRTGRTIELGPRIWGFPATRISRDAGMYIHWSGDSRRVFWSLGPELYSRELGRTFTYLAQGLSRPDDPETRGTAIGFTMKSDAPTGIVALVGARIVTMDAGMRVIENGTIIVENNRIAAIGQSATMQLPANARRVDVSGKTIMPGIVDVHAHVGDAGDGIIAQQSWPLLANLAFGVTTSHDPSNDTETVFTNAELIRAGLKVGPRLFSTGNTLYGAETPGKSPVENIDDARSHLRRMKAVGAFSVKSYNQHRRDSRQLILKAARELEMLVVPEGGSLVYSNMTMVQDGHTGVEHALPVPHVYQDLVQLLARTDVGYTPTIIVGYGGTEGENYFYQHYDVWRNELLARWTPMDVLMSRSRRRQMVSDDDYNHVRIARGAKSIQDAGGLVNLGAHGQLQGLGAHWEMWMMEQGGMSPLDAIRVATINGARYLGMEKEIGSLEPGKLADLIVLDKNPLENIRNSDSVRMVMVNGRIFDPMTLNELGRPGARPALYFQK